jgi:hypothetical protein
MDAEKLKYQIEILANFFEEEGFVREAYHLDTYLNSIDLGNKTANKSFDLKTQIKQIYDMVSRVLNNVVGNMKKVNEMNPEEYEIMNAKFRKLFMKIKPLIVSIQKSSADSEQKMQALMNEIK